MNRKNIVLVSFLAILLSSCLFDSDDSGLANWLSDQGLPNNYKVQMVTVENLLPLSAEVFQDFAPVSGRDKLVLGATSNLSHDIVMDFLVDSAFVKRLSGADSTKSLLAFHFLDAFYGFEDLPQGVLPIKETLNLKVSWKLSDVLSKKDVEAVEDISDSAWYEELKNWEPDASADTMFDIAVTINEASKSVDTTALFNLPGALIEDICEKVGNRRLQLRLSAPEASHIYRFYGIDNISPSYSPVAFKDTTYYMPKNGYTPMRAASIYSNKETCSDCLILHGGITDSLVVEYPSAPIMKALAEFYGDDFPYAVGDSNDVRQAVVMAQITYERDDSEGSSELGLPIQVVAGTYLDVADSVIRVMESYKLTDAEDIQKRGHQNLVFHEGNTFSLQVTSGMREFINKASDGRTFKMMMRLLYPILQEKDSLYSNHTITVDGVIDTVNVIFPLFDYARYDMTQSMKKPATLKLWLASKRGNE